MEAQKPMSEQLGRPPEECSSPLVEDSLIAAIKAGNIRTISLLLQKGKFTPEVQLGPDQLTPLHIACQHGQTETVQFLLTEFGYNNASCSKTGQTPLHISAQNGHVEIVQMLHQKWDQQGNVSLKKEKVPTRRSATVSYSQPQSSEESLPDPKVKQRSLTVDLQTYQTSIPRSKTSIQFGLVTDNNGNTPLHLAAAHNHLAVAQYLLHEVKCSPRLTNKEGWNALHLAAKHGNMDILKLLVEAVKMERELYSCAIAIKHPADSEQATVSLTPPVVPDWNAPLAVIIATGDYNGDTLLHLATIHGHLTVVQYLLHVVKCSPYLTNSEGSSALHLAAKYGHFEVLKILVEVIRGDRKKPESAKTVEQHCQKTDSSKVEVSLTTTHRTEAPPPVTVPSCVETGNHDGSSWNHSNSKPQEIVLLKSPYPACISAGDHNGDTPLHLAAAHNHLAVVKYLLHEVKCSPQLTNNKGQTALHMAAKHGHVSAIMTLVETIKNEDKKKARRLSTSYLDSTKAVVSPIDSPTYFRAEASSFHSDSDNSFKIPHSELQESEHHEDTYLASISTGDGDGDTLLHYAAAQNRLPVIKYLLHEIKCSPRLINNEGQTALHLAAKHGHIELLKYIIDETDCPLTPIDDYGQTPLFLAAGNGQLDVVKYFTLEKQCDIHVVTSSKEIFAFPSGQTLLHVASRGGNWDIVRFLVEKLKLNPCCTDAEGTLPLHLACLQGHIDIVKYFVENLKMSPTSSRQDGCTPLHMAALGGHTDIVKYLVKNFQCDPLCRDKYGNTPLFWAKLRGSSDVTKYLKIFETQSSPKTEDDGKESLYNANLDVLKYLIQEELVDFSPKDGKGTSPLHIASKNGDLDLVQYLVNKKKCSPTCRDEYGNTPLHSAALGGYLNVVKYFITEKDCCPIEKGNLGRTPLHFASQEGYLDIVKSLVDDYHVDASYPDDRGSTPLHVASKNDHLDTVRYFVEEKKCSPMYKNKDRDTPVHYAALGGSMSVVQYFITERKCNVMVGGKEGKTPVHKACSNGHLGLAKYLVDEEQADPFSLDDNGFTPLHEACMSGHLNVVKYLVEEKQCDALLVESKLTADKLVFQVGFEEGKMKVFLKDFTLKSPRAPLHCATVWSHLNVVKYLIDDLQVNPSYSDGDGTTPLHMASVSGCTEMVKYLVEEKHCDPMLRNKKGNTTLNTAAASGHLDIFKLLVKQKHCNPMEGGWKGRTPLHDASQEGHFDIVVYLVEEGVFNPSTPDEQGITPLHLASARDHLDIAKFFVEKKQLKPLNYKDSNGNTPIDLAVLIGSWNVILYFATKGYCSPMVKDTKGFTALHYFSMKGCLSSVKQLVDELQADASCKDNLGVTPLHVASANGHLTIVKYLVEEKQCDLHCRDSDGDTPLSWATLKDNLDVVKYFIIEKQCNPMEKYHCGKTLLHTASQKGHINVVKYLVNELRVTASSLDSKDVTPLHVAAGKGHLEVVRHLVKEFNCDPQYCCGFGMTPHKIAAVEGQWDVVVFFATERNCDPNVDDDQGRTALHHYIKENKLEMVKKIVNELQADPSTPDEEGRVPLHVASNKGNLEMVRYLVEERKCDPMLKTKSGNTSLNFAALSGHLNILQYLIHERHCNPAEGGWRGRTPLHDASQEGHLNIVRYLVEEEGVDPSCTDIENATALHSASHNDHLQTVQYLIAKQCNPMHEDQDGNTPIKIAVSERRWSVVMYFVTVGYFSPNERSLVVTMFQKACSDGRLDVMQCLVHHLQADPSIPDDGITPLHIASTKGHLAMVEYLLECKCDPLYKWNDGNTPMNCAALEGHLNILQFLITKKNYSPLTKGRQSRTLLHNASQEGHLHIVKYLADMQEVDASCEDEVGLTPLHLACESGHMGVVKYLVSQKFCDPSISQPRTPSPIELAYVKGNTEIAVYLLGKCTMAPKSNELIKAVLKAFPVLSPSVQVYIVGNRSSGKSTLAKAIQDEDSQVTGRFFNVSGVTAETAGIDPIQFDSKTCGKVTLYDFAGHEEYHGSHEALFESTSHPVFLIAVDLKLPDEEILRNLKYWMSLASKGVTRAQSQADIILVGSHADELKKELQPKRDLLAEFVRSSSELKFANIQCVGWADLDCRKSASAGMTKLRRLLEQSCRSARFRADYNNTNAFLLKTYLSESYVSRRTACTFSQLFDALLHDEKELFNTLKHPTRLCEACESLNTSGDIVFLKSHENIEDSWIILDKGHILSHVQGILKMVKSQTTTGIVPWSLLCKKTNDTSTSSLVVEYMLKMEFCSEIERQSLRQIKGTNEAKEGDRYFFFPDLTKEKASRDVWQEDSRYTNKFGWMLKCSESDSTNFFTPRFLQVLLVRLTCRYALTSRPDSPVQVGQSEGCIIWTKGIRWKDPNLMGEILVEVIEQNTAVVVLMKCMHNEDKDMQFLKLRSSLIREIVSIKSKHCSNLNATQFLIHPEHVQQYPIHSVSGLPLSEVASAIVRKEPSIVASSGDFLRLSDLLLFDPFENFGPRLLQELSSSYQHSREVKVTDSTLRLISIAGERSWVKLAEILEVDQDLVSKLRMDTTKTEIEKCRSILDRWSSRKGTYSQLYEQLSSYSVLTGMVCNM